MATFNPGQERPASGRFCMAARMSDLPLRGEEIGELGVGKEDSQFLSDVQVQISLGKRGEGDLLGLFRNGRDRLD